MVHPRELDQAGPPGPCRWCRKSDWADLGEGGVVEALITIDDERRDSRGEGTSAILPFIGGVLTSGIAILLAVTFVAGMVTDPDLDPEDLAGGLVGIVFVVLFVGLFAMLGAVLLRRCVRRVRAGARPIFPTRWSYAPARASLFAASRTGEAQGTPGLLAPFSGKPCLAYEVGVRPDEIDIDAAWSWSMLDQEIGPMTVDGQPLPAQVFLRGKPQSFARPKPGDPRAAEVDKALRERGIDAERPGYELFETLVLPGETVEVKGKGNRCVLIVAG